MIKEYYFYDTSALLAGAKIEEPAYISPIVIQELENIKTSGKKDEETRFKARRLVSRLIHRNLNWETFFFEQEKIEKELKRNPILSPIADHYMIAEALLLSKKGVVNFYTSDGCLYLYLQNFPTIRSYYVEVKEVSLPEGFKRIEMTEEISEKMKGPHLNFFKSPINEYVIFSNGDIVRWDGTQYVKLGYEPIKTQYSDRIFPRSDEQKIAFDLLQNPDISVINITGDPGGGKTFLALHHALYGVQKGYYDKIYYLRNNVNVADVPDVGARPGDLREKLQEYLMPLADNLGGMLILDSLIDQEIIEPLYLGSLKGRNLARAFILCDESEDMTLGHVRLAVGRVGEDSKICFCGDLAQLDHKACIGRSGLQIMAQRLEGQPLFGMVKLNKTERSKTAELARFLI